MSLAVLADAANVSGEGKLNILGIFTDVNPSRVPFVLPQAYIVAVLECPPAEAGLDKIVTYKLIDDEGRQVFTLEQTMTVPTPVRPGARTKINVVIGVGGLRFERTGDYQLSVLVSGEEKRSVPLLVNEPSAPEPLQEAE